MLYTWTNKNSKEVVETDSPNFTAGELSKGLTNVFIGNTNISPMNIAGSVDDKFLAELLEESDWEVKKKKADIVKCIYCGYVSFIKKGHKSECGSCVESDLHASIIGQKIDISVLTGDIDLDEWCQNHSWNDLEVISYDVDSKLIWVKDCPYGIKIGDIA